MRLTKTTSHAVRILLDCAVRGDELVKVAEIAQRLAITQLNVFKIVHLLSRAGFIEAVRGRHGGVRLARPPAEIRVGDVIRAMENTEIEVVGLADSKARIRRDTKPHLNSIFDDALEAFISVLDQHTLADLTASSRVAKSPVRASSKNPRRKRASGKPMRRSVENKAV